MTDEQFKAIERMLRDLRSEVLDVKARVGELEWHLQRQDKAAERHHDSMFEWTAPRELKDALTSFEGMQEISAPADVVDALETFLQSKRSPSK